MKLLVLKDGATFEFTNTSTIYHLITVYNDFGRIDGVRESLTEDNLSECIFDGVKYKDVLLSSITAQAQGNENVVVTILTKTQSDTEIEVLKAQIAELEAQNSSLINENEQLSDKAEATDILLGNEEV